MTLTLSVAAPNFVHVRIDAALLKRVLELPESQRAALAHKLLLSLEPQDFDSDAARLWAREIQARIFAAERREARLLDWRSSASRIRRQLQQDREEDDGR